MSRRAERTHRVLALQEQLHRIERWKLLDLQRRAAELDTAHAALLLELQPEVVLIGTGQRQVFPAPAFGVQFLKVGIGFEAMDTGAACRTFNVLVSEQRLVVALLIV